MARHMEGPVEDWQALLAERKEEEQPARPEKARELALLELFRQKFEPVSANIYYPGCGTNTALRTVFRDSHITYVDADPDEVQLRKLFGADEQATLACAFADMYVPDTEMDIVYGKGVPFDLSVAIQSVKIGGYYLCNMNDAAQMFDIALQNPDFQLVAVLQARTAPEQIEAITTDTVDAIEAILQSHLFIKTEGLEDYTTPCESDEELQRLRPDIYGPQKADIPHPRDPNEILRSVAPYTAINSPKRASARYALYAFKRIRKSNVDRE